MSATSKVERFFDQGAPTYDKVVSGNGWPVNALLREEVAAISRVDRVLDLGAGTGLSTEAILDTAVPRSVVSVDVSTKMLEHLRHRCGRHPTLSIATMAIDQFLTEVRFKSSSVELLHRLRNRFNSDAESPAGKTAPSQFTGGPHARFDLVIAMGLLHFLPSPEEVIAGTAGVLSGTGRFIFTYDPLISGHPIHGERQTDYGVPVYRSTPQEIHSDLRRSNLEVLTDRPFIPQPYGNVEYQNRFVVAKKTLLPDSI